MTKNVSICTNYRESQIALFDEHSIYQKPLGLKHYTAKQYAHKGSQSLDLYYYSFIVLPAIPL